MTYLRSVFIFLFISYMTFSLSAQGNSSFESKVKDAVRRQMETYPASTLKDLYKNFFQDKYGPGHLINDPDASGNYLKRELENMKESSGELIEPTGWEGHFYRVNLSLIKDGVIPYELFFKVFVESVNSIEPLPVEKWEKEWIETEQIIRSMNLNLPGYESDRNYILEHLKKGEYVGHHSEVFEKSYSPHYRIVSKTLFEKELLPLLEEYLKTQH